MKAKKLVAILAVATMLLGTVPVSAADTATGSGTITGEGTVVDYDKTPVYEVTLPTGNALNFTIDPHGLLGVASGSAVDLSTGSGTTPIVTATNAGAVITNRSSVPITVDVDFAVVNKVTDGATFVATEGGLNVETPAIWLTMIPSENKAATATGATYVTDTAVTILNGTSATYSLKAAEYQVANVNGTLKLQIKPGATNYEGTVFKLAGKVNQADGWEKYRSGDLGITAVFNYKVDESETPAQIVTDTYALVAGTQTLRQVQAKLVLTNTAAWVGNPDGSSITGLTNNAVVKVNGVVCPFSFDSGYLVVTFDTLNEKLGTVASYNFSVVENGVEYVASYPES